MRTASTCTPCTVRGTHTFKITGYSLHRGLGVGECVRSATFDVGDYLWRIEYASVFLELVSKNTHVRASVEARLVDQASKLPPSVVLSQEVPLVFTYQRIFGDDFLKPSAYLWDDSLVIECDITVLKEYNVTLTSSSFDIPVPPSDLAEYFRELLEKEDEADVSFVVKGEVFPAHRIVVAARSPVFKAELFGPMSNKARQTIPVEDMQPAVLKALLHFIYTDSLPSVENLDGDEGKDMVKHLLVAADRYALENGEDEVDL